MTLAHSASRTLCFARSGMDYDVADPNKRPIDFGYVAECLARMIRFRGTMGAISVLQHQVMGAEAIIAEGGTPIEAALFLHHDDHEFILGDQSVPVTATLEILHPGHRAAWSLLKSNWDVAIYTALRLPPPDRWLPGQVHIVSLMDQRMQAAESRMIFGPHTRHAFTTIQLRTPRFKTNLHEVWKPGVAEDRWFDTHKKLTGRNLR